MPPALLGFSLSGGLRRGRWGSFSGPFRTRARARAVTELWARQGSDEMGEVGGCVVGWREATTSCIINTSNAQIKLITHPSARRNEVATVRCLDSLPHAARGRDCPLPRLPPTRPSHAPHEVAQRRRQVAPARQRRGQDPCPPPSPPCPPPTPPGRPCPTPASPCRGRALAEDADTSEGRCRHAPSRRCPCPPPTPPCPPGRQRRRQGAPARQRRGQDPCPPPTPPGRPWSPPTSPCRGRAPAEVADTSEGRYRHAPSRRCPCPPPTPPCPPPTPPGRPWSPPTSPCRGRAPAEDAPLPRTPTPGNAAAVTRPAEDADTGERRCRHAPSRGRRHRGTLLPSRAQPRTPTPGNAAAVTRPAEDAGTGERRRRHAPRRGRRHLNIPAGIKG
ncbi:hypothetical protein BDA96_07G128500 [Sorghum bicolor]|uniref:Uncharacterized protein n=1 Tax=Sorghum bicolor TaxID=4558 RepID=A0A921UAD2_SORBI|nr:hypothetical protein BDA96_07G128500 [Sorghum bicolor]